MSRAMFSLGQLVATPGAITELTPEEMRQALGRHQRGDWGELDSEDKQANEWALRNGARLLSAYRSADGEKFWVITEADRSVTTVLLPSEY